MNLKNFVSGVVMVASVAISSMAFADVIDAVPTNWRIQSYGGSPNLWFTGSSCQNGQIILDPSITSDAQKALWAAILTAKSANLKVHIEFNVSGGNCLLTSFAVDGPG